ncbi:MAG: 23S rRNA (pseudouridine(1915)-N(3))-methyltransferase RlmH [Planctomycetota bacterium]
MKVQLLTVSQRQPRWVVDGCAEYEKRMPRPWHFRCVEVKPAARTSGADGAKVRADEARRLRAAIPGGARTIVLDEGGAAWSTKQFADQFARWQREARDLFFVIGGADGFDPSFRKAADHSLSLSPMTMPHGLARVVFIEQLYRIATVLDGHPYHKS